MPQIEVGFLPVNRNIAFAMFVGIECTRIDIDVGIEFLVGYAEASCLK